jgi:hypothetical protein
MPMSPALNTPNTELTRAQRWKKVLGPILAVLLIALILVILGILSRRPRHPDPLVFARDVYIFLDVTQSLNHDGQARAFEDAKDNIVRKELPNIGPGDRVFCYIIATDFPESQNRVFDGPAPLEPVRESWLSPPSSRVNSGRVSAQALEKLWQPVDLALNPMGGGWPLKVGALKQQERGHSNYIAAFNYAAERLLSPERTPVRERYVIVFGDLVQDPFPDPFVPPDPTEPMRVAFKDCHVELAISYLDTTGPLKLPSRDKVRQFWQLYFTDRGNAHPNFHTLNTAAPLLPASAVPKPVEKPVPGKDKQGNE